MEGNPPHIATLQKLIQLLKLDKNYKQAIKHGTTNYSITQYKINKVRLEEIPELVNLIEVNYINLEKQSEHAWEKKKNSWLANQLKLFVWMAICHSYITNKPLEQYNQHQWQFFTTILTRKTTDDLEFQSKSLFKNYKGNKQKWEEEQSLLLKTILQDEKYQNKWNEVSRLMYFQSNKKYYRSSQKCRQYWFNHLDDRLNKSAWTVDEDLRLVSELLTYGFKWSKLTQVIESTWGYRRTQHMVKNRTKLLCRKYGYKDQKQQGCMKQLRMIQKKLKEQRQKQQRQQSSTPQIKIAQINQVKQQESVQQKSFPVSSNSVCDGNEGSGKGLERRQTSVVMNGNNNHQQMMFCLGNVANYAVSNIMGSRVISQPLIKCQQYPVTMQKLPLLRGKHQLSNHNNNQNEQHSYSEFQSSDQSSSQIEKGNKHNKQKNSKKNIKSRKAKRPIKRVFKRVSSQSQSQSQSQQQQQQQPVYSQSSQSQSQSMQQQSSLQQQQQCKRRRQNTTRRNVILVYQGGKSSNNNHQQMMQQQQVQGQNEHPQQQSSSQMVIGQHIDQQEQKHNGQYDRQSECNDKEDYYYDQYNIIERVPDQQQIDLNEDIQFQHDTHGGKMRERVTHQLAKYFPTDN